MSGDVVPEPDGTPGAAAPLLASYRGLVCDLDGVVYRGPDPVEHAVEALTGSPGRSGAVPVVYATNNASRPPAEVADHLTHLGLATEPDQVVTSSQAGAARLVELVGVGAEVLAVGGAGVSQALEEVGLVARRTLQSPPSDDGESARPPGVHRVVGVLQGYGTGVTAGDLAQASYAVERGAVWVATNTDATLPTDQGVAPGNGTLVAAVARASGAEPVVVGKPEAPLYDLAVSRLGRRHHEVLAIGDRLDTDILGAMAAGLDSLWVLTGVDDLSSLVHAGARGQAPTPTWVADDLRALHRPRPDIVAAREAPQPDAATSGSTVTSSWSAGDVTVTLVGTTGAALTLSVGAAGKTSDPTEGAETSLPEARHATSGVDRRTALLTMVATAVCVARDDLGAGPEELAAMLRSVETALG